MERKNQQRRSTVQDKWSEGEDSGVFSWPQRNYTCTFCRKQFSSAQALGGHMNVHRRERARLRELPSWFFERPKFNPTSSISNPNPNFSSSSTSNFLPCPHSSTTHHSLLSPSLTTSFSSVLSYPEKKPKLVECPQHKDLTKKKRTRAVVGVGDQLKKTFPQEYNCEEKLKNSETSINLDLEMGYKDRKEFLDLELRLGYFQH